MISGVCSGSFTDNFGSPSPTKRAMQSHNELVRVNGSSSPIKSPYQASVGYNGSASENSGKPAMVSIGVQCSLSCPNCSFETKYKPDNRLLEFPPTLHDNNGIPSMMQEAESSSWERAQNSVE